MTPQQMQALSAKSRWRGKSKAERAAIMAEVARKRWQKQGKK